MEEQLYNSYLKYFTFLGNFGYRNYEEVKKLLVYTFIQELVNTTSIVISEEDYRAIENALYCLYGTSCLIPYPDYCEMNKLHLGDIAELSARVAHLEEDVQELQDLDYVLTDGVLEEIDSQED